MDTLETENEKRLMQNAKIDYIDRVLKQLEQSNCLITIWATGFAPENITNAVGVMCEQPIKEMIYTFLNNEKKSIILDEKNSY